MNLKPIESVQKSLSELLKQKNKYLLAFSSGGDSVFLLFQLHFFYQEKLKDHITLVYINYHDSPFVAQEESIFFHYVSLFGLTYFKKDVHYRKSYGNFEEWARKYRYDYFQKLCSSYQYKGVITAHQKTDLVETYLLQLKRNNLPKHYGLSTTSLYKGRPILRPRLSISKEALTKQLVETNTLFYDDITNYNRKKSRNRIRQEIKEEDRNREIKEAENRNNFLSSLYACFNQRKPPFSFDDYYLRTVNQRKRFCFYLLEKSLNKTKFCYGLGKKRYSFLCNRESGVMKLTENLFLYRWKEGFFLFSDLQKISYQYIFKEKKIYQKKYFRIDLKDPSAFNRKSLPVLIRNYREGDQLGTDLVEKDVFAFLRKQGVPSFLIPIYPVFIQNKKIQCVPFYKDLKKEGFPLSLSIPCLFVRSKQVSVLFPLEPIEK